LLIEDVGIGVLFLLAFASGANDVGKSVATIVETHGARSIRRALVFGGLFSALGSVTAVLIATQLLSTFTTTLLTPTPADTFILAALCGTLVWILGATLLRLPVSLTQAIVGSILFLAVYLFGLHSIPWTSIIIRVFLPLAAGPFAAFLLGYLAHKLKHGPATPSPDTAKKPGVLLGAAHWSSVAATAFARGINDAPKMIALGIIILPATLKTSAWQPYALVGIAVFLGSIIWGHWVTQTLVGRFIPLSHDRRVTTGVATAALVSFGALLGAPLSTTHMTAGAHAGIGGAKREHLQSALVSFLIAWLVTLPLAGLISIGTFLLIGRIPGF